jgi:inhibitor of cysteine peptidase
MRENNDGELTELRPGERLEVRLPENRTTGYRWRLDDAADGVVALTDDRFEAPEGRMGASGERVLHFSGRAPGAGAIRLVYGRPGATEPARSYSLRVRVR